MLFDASVPNASPTLLVANLRATAKGTQRATFDLHLTALGITLVGCILRRHDGYAWVDLPRGARGVVSYMPDSRRRFHEQALAAVRAVAAMGAEQ
jgi:hypothetical protein